MSDTIQPLFLTYVSGSGSVQNPYFFDVSFNDNAPQKVLMDTGSPWLNIGEDLLPEGTYAVCDPQPHYPPPSYSSDGKTYEGQWVTSKVTVIGGNGVVFTIPSMILFRTTTPGVAMMGVSTRFMGLDELVTFLNVPGMVDGSFPAGYILDQYGATFGYDLETFNKFTQVPVVTIPAANSQHQQRTAIAQVTLTGPAGGGLPTYGSRLPFLMDTGIDYTIITPNTLLPTQPPTPAPGPLPDPTQWETANPLNVEALIPGVVVTVDLGSAVSWGFTTNQDIQDPPAPAYARLAVPSDYGIVNTGRHFLASFRYLIQLNSRLNADTGTMGFLPVLGTVPSA